MSTQASQLAERLLEAQVQYVVAELSGPQAAELVALEVRGVLDALADVRIGKLAEPAGVQATANEILDRVGSSSALAAMVTTLVPALYQLPAHEEHRLGDVVMWGGVEAIADVLTRSKQLREELMERLSRSPAVSTLAMRFVAALVDDAVQQNRERAQRVPGMKSMLDLGDFAARQARDMAPTQLEKMVGGAADKGTQAALDRVRRALVDAFDEDVVREAVMQVWDLHAEDDVAGLRAYLPEDDVEHVAASAHALWLDAHPTPWFRAVIGTAIDAFFGHYGEQTVGEVLEDLDLDRDAITVAVERHAPRILDVLHRDGHLEALVRRRLAPFYESDVALALLADGG